MNPAPTIRPAAMVIDAKTFLSPVLIIIPSLFRQSVKPSALTWHVPCRSVRGSTSTIITEGYERSSARLTYEMEYRLNKILRRNDTLSNTTRHAPHVA